MNERGRENERVNQTGERKERDAGARGAGA